MDVSGHKEHEQTETVVIIFDRRRTEIAYSAGDTILETARAGGLDPPFSCEAGNCATCMAMLRQSGTVAMPRSLSCS